MCPIYLLFFPFFFVWFSNFVLCNFYFIFFLIFFFLLCSIRARVRMRYVAPLPYRHTASTCSPRSYSAFRAPRKTSAALFSARVSTSYTWCVLLRKGGKLVNHLVPWQLDPDPLGPEIFCYFCYYLFCLYARPLRPCLNLTKTKKSGFEENLSVLKTSVWLVNQARQ